MIRATQTILAHGKPTNGTVPAGRAVTLSLTINRNAAVSRGVVRFRRDGESERLIPLVWRGASADRETWTASLDPLPAGLYFYDFELSCGVPSPVTLGGGRDLSPGGVCQLTAYPRIAPSASVLAGKTIYHIFVDRFRRSGRCAVRDGARFNPDWEHGVPSFAAERGGDNLNDDFFGGDLWGVAEKLDYISSLGADYIDLSPVFAARSNHKYDVGDYLAVDPAFGGDEALAHLAAEAKKRGMGLILDGVFDHTGDDSVYFNKYGHYPSLGAYQSPSSPYFGWYDFRSFPDDYASWWNVPILPKVRTAEPSFRRFICDTVLPKWSALGISNWRLDVADELSDEFLDDLRAALTALDPRSVVIGEVWDDASNKIAYGRRRRYFMSGQLDSVMNYPLRDAVIAYVLRGDAAHFRRTVEGILRHYPPHVARSLMNFLGTHDTPRILTVLGGGLAESAPNAARAADRLSPEHRGRAIRLTALAFMLTAILPGALSIYYGDEAGLEGHDDPFCRRPFPWGGEDPTLLSLVSHLGWIRHSHRAFADGRPREQYGIPHHGPLGNRTVHADDRMDHLAHDLASVADKAVFNHGLRTDILGRAEVFVAENRKILIRQIKLRFSLQQVHAGLMEA